MGAKKEGKKAGYKWTPNKFREYFITKFRAARRKYSKYPKKHGSISVDARD